MFNQDYNNCIENNNKKIVAISIERLLDEKIIIPNEHKHPSHNHTAIIHKGKKFNYVCDINPQTINSISGKITDLSGLPIFHGSNTNSIYTYTLS